jgi:hypothetical protein
VAAALAATLVLAACGDDDDGDDASTDTAAEATTTATEPSDASTEASEPASPVDEAGSGGVEDGVLEVHTVDYAFEGLPGSVPSGTRLALVNDSEEELHELVAIRIPDEETRSVEELVALPEEEIDAVFGSGEPAAVLLAAPGGEQIDAVGDGTISDPGRYALVCFIPTGVDPQEYLDAPPTEEGPPSFPDAGPPHVAHGMYAELTVE